MTGLPLALGLVVFALGLGFALAYRLAGSIFRHVVRTIATVGAAGAVVGAVVTYLERLLLGFTGLDFDVHVAGVGGALMAVFLLAAPLEEAAKVLVVWPLYRRGRLLRPRFGVLYAVVAASGFAAVEGAIALFAAPTGLTLVRALLGTLAHLFFAGVWGYVLGAGRFRSSWFSVAWLFAMLLHGLFDHILWGRGPGYLTATLPIVFFMLLASVLVLRERAPELAQPSLLSKAPTNTFVAEVLGQKDHPVALRWVIAGAFVTLGLVLALAVFGVVIGRRFGVDFALADESDVRSAVPLVLLGSCVLLAFPVSGFLIARASSVVTVLEPALATVVAVVTLVIVSFLTAPIAILFTLAVAPVAVGLACGGAWIGLER
jgi:RsiW-degrading membrane proteinase PrsW (M82 family)